MYLLQPDLSVQKAKKWLGATGLRREEMDAMIEQLACSHVRRSKIPHEMLVVLDRGKDVIMLSKVLFILILVYPGEGATLPCE